MTLVEVRGLVKHYAGERSWFGLGRPRAPVRAVDDVSFTIAAGRTLGLVGESGSGKTTVGRTMLRLQEPTAGKVLFDGHDVFALDSAKLRALRRRMQIVFQDPYSSLNPRMTVGQTLREPLEIHHLAGEVSALLEEVGLDAEFARRYVDGREPLPVEPVLALAGLRFESDTIREPRLGIGTASDSSGVRISQVASSSAAAAAGARVGDQIVSIGDVMITNDDSFEKFRTRYAGTKETTLPLIVRRGPESLTLQLPIRLSTRVRTRVVPLPNASAKASRIRHGVLTGR